MPIHQTARTFGARRVPATTAASGCWQLGEVTQARRADIWPAAVDNVRLLLQDSLSDDSSYSHSVVAGGNAVASTAEVKVGTHSIKFDGATDYLDIANSADLALGDDFTVELWLYLTALPGSGIVFVYDQRTNANHAPGKLVVVITAAGQVDVYENVLRLSSNTSLTTGQWQHLAIVRYQGVTTVYIDGTDAGSTSGMTETLVSGTSALRIGASTFGAANSLNGYIDGFRLSSTAQYTSAFTPPTAPFPTS